MKLGNVINLSATCMASYLSQLISGPKRDEETGGWRKLHNEELNNL
jgi:hypothetical protein